MGAPTRPVTIVAGDTRATIDLDAGGCLTSWRVGLREFIVAPEGREPLWWGAFPMAPWTSIRRGAPGGDLCDEADPDGLAPWHGVARRVPWAMLDAGADFVVLRAGLSPLWRPGGHLEARIEVGPSALRYRLSMTAGTVRTDAALGWHPWFVGSLQGHAGALALPARVLVQERTPSGEATHGWRESVDEGDRAWDDCIVADWPIGIDYGPAGMLEVSASCRYATLFRPTAGGLCIEPVTSPAEFTDEMAPRETRTLDVECWFREQGASAQRTAVPSAASINGSSERVGSPSQSPA